ncbi:double homeobox protein A [Sus scrofa]|uniref:double homeobox protein A n=1 Tax=Sus scrofa TaxID=9823 RepID=UPI000A2B0115|nr:double homeobox protein A [Sus scrofa]
MAQDNSANKTMEVSCRRRRTKFTEEQLKILINAFNQKPYPSSAARRQLALKVNTEESRIQMWFQNRRARHPFPKRSEENTDASQDQAHPSEKIQSRGDRRCRTSYSPSQLQTLIKAFVDNPYPGISCREELAEETGVPESTIQTWFQNRRSRLYTQKKGDPEETSDEGQDQGQDLQSETTQGTNPSLRLGLRSAQAFPGAPQPQLPLAGVGDASTPRSRAMGHSP